MARRRSVLTSRTSRGALPSSDAPHWEVISPGVRLGYRSGRGTQGRGGTWLAAGRAPDGRRVQTRLGRADDLATEGALSHEQAKDAARAWAKALRAGEPVTRGLTVSSVIDRYLEAKEVEGAKSLDDTRSRVKCHIRPALGDLLVTELTVERVRRWRDALVKAPKRFRAGKSSTKTRIVVVSPGDSEGLRQRRDTANRVLTVLKAALNWAFNNRLVSDDTAWRFVKPFKGVGAARVRFLDDVEQRRLLNAAIGSIRHLIAAALSTGARASELARLRICDFDPENGSVFIAESKSGKSRHIPLTSAGLKLFCDLVKGRSTGEPILRQPTGLPWKRACHHRAFKTAVASAKLNAVTFHELRHSYASTMIRAGAPLIVVAEVLGHADTRMVTKHYGHLAPSFVADTVRRTAPNLSIAI
jgi:integrase